MPWLGTRGLTLRIRPMDADHSRHLGLRSCSHRSGHSDSRACESPWDQAYRGSWTSVGAHRGMIAH